MKGEKNIECRQLLRACEEKEAKAISSKSNQYTRRGFKDPTAHKHTRASLNLESIDELRVQFEYVFLRFVFFFFFFNKFFVFFLLLSFVDETQLIYFVFLQTASANRFLLKPLYSLSRCNGYDATITILSRFKMTDCYHLYFSVFPFWYIYIHDLNGHFVALMINIYWN